MDGWDEWRKREREEALLMHPNCRCQIPEIAHPFHARMIGDPIRISKEDFDERVRRSGGYAVGVNGPRRTEEDGEILRSLGIRP